MLATEEQSIEKDNVELRLFPNPASDVLHYTFNINDEIIKSVRVMDMLGKIVEIDNAKAIDQRQINLDGNNISSGIYYLRLTINKGQYTKKFSVMK